MAVNGSGSALGASVDAVLFDVDGTLVDSVDLHARAWRAAFARWGKDVDFLRVRAQIGKGTDQLLPEFLKPWEIQRFGHELDEWRSERWKSRYLSRVEAFPGVRALFERIRRDGKRIALASSAKGDELQRYLEIMDVADLIEGSTSSDDADRSKPHPDIFEAALARAGNPPRSRALVVGDTPWDAIAARHAGLETIGLLTGGWPADTLRRMGVFAVYVDPADLLNRYDESPIKHPERYRLGTPFPELIP